MGVELVVLWYCVIFFSVLFSGEFEKFLPIVVELALGNTLLTSDRVSYNTINMYDKLRLHSTIHAHLLFGKLLIGTRVVS